MFGVTNWRRLSIQLTRHLCRIRASLWRLTFSRPPARVALAWPVIGKHNVIHKTGSTQRIATSPDKDWATATGNVRSKLVMCADAGHETCHWADRQTDRQTDMLITILRFPSMNDVNIIHYNI